MGYGLAEHMTFKRLLKAAFPCILMMVAISIYSVVDGFFLSNFAGKAPFAAVNLIYPVIMVLATMGFLMGAGGSALVSKRFGQGKDEEGNIYFSNCVFFSISIGIVASVLVFIFLPDIALLLGADEEMLPLCVLYGRILVVGSTAFNLQNLFQSFFTAAEKPQLGTFVTLLAGVVNIVLDAILIAGFHLGILGAAIGTVAGQVIGAAIPFVYFTRKNPSRLRLRLHAFHFKAIAKMVSNGSSEFATNISASAVSMVMNVGLMEYYGQNGVGAYGTICYVWMIFAAVFIGYNIAVAPRIAYALGAGEKAELRNLFHKSLIMLAIFGVTMFALSAALSVPVSYIFGGYDEGLQKLTAYGSLLYSFTYISLGISMFGSCFFTALNNGLVSFLLSYFRLGVIEIACVMVLPIAFGGDAVWVAVPVAEFLGSCVNIAVMTLFAKKYGYSKEQIDEQEDDQD